MTVKKMSKFITLDLDETIISKSQISAEVSERNKLYRQNQKLISKCKKLVGELKEINQWLGLIEIEKSIYDMEQLLKECEE